MSETADVADMDFDDFMDAWPCRVCGSDEHMTEACLSGYTQTAREAQ